MLGQGHLVLEHDSRRDDGNANWAGQVAQGMRSGEVRRESRGAHAREDFLERGDGSADVTSKLEWFV